MRYSKIFLVIVAMLLFSTVALADKDLNQTGNNGDKNKQGNGSGKNLDLNSDIEDIISGNIGIVGAPKGQILKNFIQYTKDKNTLVKPFSLGKTVSAFVKRLKVVTKTGK